MSMETRMLPITQVFPNIGQVKGLPKNPRFIRDEKYKKLVQSIKDDPEMLELRELIVYDTDDPSLGYVVAGGNMRYRAMKELGFKEVPCKVLHTGFPIDKLRRIVLKDNSSFGETDFQLLIDEWSMDEIELAAIDIPEIGDAVEDDHEDAPKPQEESTVEEDNDFEQNDVLEDDIVQEGDLWKLGRHMLLCGDSCKREDVQRLFPNGEQADLWLTDPPYNVGYGFEGSVRNERTPRKDGLVVLNDKQDNEHFLMFLTDAFIEAKSILRAGGVYYIFHSDTYSYYFRQALINVGDMDLRQNLIWNKNSLVLGRQDYHWKHEPCQPAGTLVQTTEGVKPIETLTNKDRVISFDSLSGQVVGYRNGGYAIETASRHYKGLLYSISVGGHTTKATDNHDFSIRFNGNCKKAYCTYLMRRGNWWRVGHTRAYDARQFGLKSRLSQEKAEEAWLIEMYDNRLDAQVGEQILAVKYGIPYTHWEVERGMAVTDNVRNEKQIADIYDALDLKMLRENAYRLLHDFGRSERFPLITRLTVGQRFSTRVTAKINACNLIPELMQVPIPTGNGKDSPNFTWESITHVSYKSFDGMVYSLAVEKHHHYISDGIITHNCLYGWKDGAAHNWYSDRKQSTVIDWDRPTKAVEHPCLDPSTLVFTINGYKPIGDIVKGEMVLSSDGKFHKVEFVSKHPYNEPIYNIKADGSNIYDRATHNHPYLIARRKKDGTFEVGFMVAEKLRLGDYLMTPHIEQGKSSPISILDAWCFGLWLAQGSLQAAGHGDNKYPVFSLDARKKELKDKLYEWGGDKCKTYPNGNGNGIKIIVFDSEKAEQCVELCGKYAEKKKISEEIFEWSEELRRAFFEGYMAGDGCTIKTRGHRHSKSISMPLASQIRYIAESLGYRTSFYQREPKKGAGIGERKFKEMHTCYATDYRKAEGNKILEPFEYNGVKYVLRRVTEITTEDYNADVINLSVEGNPTFQTVNGCTHNTMKPVGLVGYLMKNSSKKGDVVYDGFGGSGTTLIAAEQLGRCARMVELSPHYVKVIIFRYIKLRGNYADVFRINLDGTQTSIMEIFDKNELDGLCNKND